MRMNNGQWFVAVVLTSTLWACTGKVTPETSHESVATTKPAAQTDSAVADQTSAPATGKASMTGVSDVAGTADSRIYLDPNTGQPRVPTAAELAAENAQRTQINAANSSKKTVKITALPDGIMEYDLGDAARVQESVCLLPDGSLGECTAEQKQELRGKTRQIHQ
jgi:hypothetical protein